MILENTLVNYYFEKICSIPHISMHEKELSDYVCSVAKEKGLEYFQDELYNCIVKIPATPGYENKEPIMLQGHMDMVPTKTKDRDFDFLKDPLDLIYDGHILKADRTTLGADDGVAVSIMLTMMSDEFEHPLIECVFTVREEIGCDGAVDLDISNTVSRRLINLDGEKEGEVTVGNYCSSRVIITGKPSITNKKNQAYRLKIGPFEPFAFGNHRLNPMCHPMKYFFSLLRNTEAELISYDSGVAENMPPVNMETVLLLKDEDLELLINGLKEKANVEIEAMDADYCYDHSTVETLCNLVEKIENGPLTFNEKGEMITSFMFGKMKVNKEGIEIIGSTRCMNDELDLELLNQLNRVSIECDCSMKREIRYVSWPYRKDSPLKEEYRKVMKKVTGKEITEKLCPGGLEVTDFLAKRDFDILSIGVDAGDFHNPTEWLDVESLNRVYGLLKTMLSEE